MGKFLGTEKNQSSISHLCLPLLSPLSADILSSGEDDKFGNFNRNYDNFTLDYSLDDLVNERACELDRILAFTAEWPS